MRVKIQIVSWRDPRHPKAGGAEVCVSEIFQRLARRHPLQLSWFSSQFPKGTAVESVPPFRVERSGSAPSIHLSALKRFLFRQEADLYLEDYHGFSLCLGLYIRKPTLILIHEVAGDIWQKMWPWPLSMIGRWVEEFTLRLLRGQTFIAVSESTRKDLLSRGIPAKNIRLIQEGSNLPTIDRPLGRRERRAQICFLGRICAMKQVDVLLEAFAKVSSAFPDLQLCLAGRRDPDFEEVLQTQLARPELKNRVTLLGFVSTEQKQKLLRESLAVVSASMHEGFGLIVVEGFSQGTPAVTFEVAGYRDLVRDGELGFLAPGLTSESLANALEKLLRRSPAEYDTMAETCREESTKYSWDQAADQMWQIISEAYKPSPK